MCASEWFCRINTNIRTTARCLCHTYIQTPKCSPFYTSRSAIPPSNLHVEKMQTSELQLCVLQGKVVKWLYCTFIIKANWHQKIKYMNCFFFGIFRNIFFRKMCWSVQIFSKCLFLCLNIHTSVTATLQLQFKGVKEPTSFYWKLNCETLISASVEFRSHTLSVYLPKIEWLKITFLY